MKLRSTDIQFVEDINRRIDSKIFGIQEIKDEVNNEILIDAEGREYILVKRSRDIPRKTYLKATLIGKYWGEIDGNYSNNFERSKYYDFNIYEVSLLNTEYDSSPFELNQDLNIPRERLPKLLHTILKKDGKEYEVNLHEPTYSEIYLNRKLHQDDGDEVFGTIDAIVSGYILDYITESYVEKVYQNAILTESLPLPFKPKIHKTSSPTGNVERKGNYKRIEYYYSDFNNTFWGEWKYVKQKTNTGNNGCFSLIIGFLEIILCIVFLIFLLPQITLLLPFLLVVFLFNLIPFRIIEWVVKLIGALIFVWFMFSLFQFLKHSWSNNASQSIVLTVPKEIESQYIPVNDTINKAVIKDTLIKHYRAWQDYEGNKYQGYIWVKSSEYKNAKFFKRSLIMNQNDARSYDEVIYRLKDNDMPKLEGVYQLFDSIQKKENLTRVGFAELIVSFVQDIPYALIVPEDCDPKLYDDKFIKEYLNSSSARCDSFEKFGINSPIEFMANLYGDCDTRTLLIYTILTHYKYDVALLSSEHYNHSIIGLNMPLKGLAYQYHDQRYVLWETTISNVKAGVISREVSNLKYWRISLKSK